MKRGSPWCDGHRSPAADRICTALERARWTVWDREAFLLSRAYVDACRARARSPSWSRRTPGSRSTPTTCSTASTGCCWPAARTSTRRSYGARAPCQDDQHPPGPRPRGDRPGPARAGARPAVLGICRGMQLLNVALGGTLDPAPARRRRPHRPPALARLVRQRRPRRAAGAGLAGRARRRGDRARDQVAPPPGRRRARRGRGGDGLERARRPGRGDRGARRAAGRSACSGTRRRTRARAWWGRSRPRRRRRSPRRRQLAAVPPRRSDPPSVYSRLVRAPLDRHPRGRLHGARRRPRRAAPAPAAAPEAAGGDRRGRDRPVRAGGPRPALAQARRRRVPAADVGLSGHVPDARTTTPRRSSGGVRVAYPVSADRLIGLGTTPTLRLQRAFGTPGRFARWEKLLVWSHWLWFAFPHGSAMYVLLRHREQLPAGRRADLRDVRRRRDRLLGGPHRAAVVRRASRG